jgi:hypothetical protein
MQSRATLASRIAVTLCLILAASTAVAQSSKIFFSAPVNLSHDPDSSALAYSTRTALDAHGNINLVWAEFDCLQVNPFTCTWHLFFARSADGGSTFSAPKDLANQAPSNSLFGPQMAIDAAGNINVAWENDTAGANIFLTRSTDGGNTFSVPVNVSLDNGFASDPVMALDPHDNINLVWQAQSLIDQTSSVWFSRSSDGVNFSAPIDLCSAGETCNFPQIVAHSASHLNLVWVTAACVNCTAEVVFSRSTDAGASFSTPLNLSNSLAPLVSAPQIATDPQGHVDVVWSQGNSGAAQVFFTRSLDGVSFTTPGVLSNGAGNSEFPELALGPARYPDSPEQDLNVAAFYPASLLHACPARREAINAAWFNDATGEVFFNRSTNAGTSFSVPKAVSSPTGGFGTEPYMAVDSDGNITLVWQDGATSNILFTRSDDGGVNFSKPRKVSESPSISFSPQVAVDTTGNLNVAWFDNTTPIEDVFFSRGTSLDLLSKDIRALPNSAFKQAGKRNVILNRLAKTTRELKRHDAQLAVGELLDLLQHMEGCGISAGSNDWIVNCTAQVKIRTSVNILINGLKH